MKREATLYLDCDHLARSGTPRSYSLGIFNISASITTASELEASSGVLLTLAQRHRGFHSEIFEICTNITLLLDGVWNSERYFDGIEQVIRSDFSLKNSKSNDSCLGIEKEIVNSAAVCVHVRRGDYLTEKGSFLGFVGESYYHKAVEVVGTQIKGAHFYIFSDDIEWCRSNLCLNYPSTFVSGSVSNSEALESDFRLMTLCKHFIIANSTLSWWAAWLGRCESKLVVAPSRWLSNGTQPKDLIPDRWLML